MKTSFWTKLIDLLSPRTCAICHRRLSANERAICAVCHLHLPVTGHEYEPLRNALAARFWGKFPLERAAAWFYYESQAEVPRLLYAIKYQGRLELAEDLGAIWARRLQATGFFADIDGLVPVPLSRHREWQRGYNQSRLLASGVHQVTGLPIYNKVVKRVHFAGSQTSKNVWERQDNVAHAFQLLDGAPVQGKHLLLIDDVVTTGSTLTACALQLLRIPGVRISILSLGMVR